MGLIVFIAVLGVCCAGLYLSLRADEKKGRELIKSILRAKGEAYGREIMGLSKGFFDTGTLYPLLRQMEQEGVLVSRKAYVNLAVRRGRPRIYYRLNDSPPNHDRPAAA